jgi:hypothetical protein
VECGQVQGKGPNERRREGDVQERREREGRVEGRNEAGALALSCRMPGIGCQRQSWVSVGMVEQRVLRRLWVLGVHPKVGNLESMAGVSLCAGQQAGEVHLIGRTTVRYFSMLARKRCRVGPGQRGKPGQTSHASDAHSCTAWVRRSSARRRPCLGRRPSP